MDEPFGALDAVTRERAAGRDGAHPRRHGQDRRHGHPRRRRGNPPRFAHRRHGAGRIVQNATPEEILLVAGERFRRVAVRRRGGEPAAPEDPPRRRYRRSRTAATPPEESIAPDATLETALARMLAQADELARVVDQCGGQRRASSACATCCAGPIETASDLVIGQPSRGAQPDRSVKVAGAVALLAVLAVGMPAADAALPLGLSRAGAAGLHARQLRHADALACRPGARGQHPRGRRRRRARASSSPAPAGQEFAGIVDTVTAIGQTFPPVAVLAIAVPLVGYGAAPTMIALIAYGVLPVVDNTVAGLRSVSAAAIGRGRRHGLHAGAEARSVSSCRSPRRSSSPASAPR